MTTIAWDGKTLAADRQATSGNGTKRSVCKIHRCGKYLYAGSGELAETLFVAEWIRRGAKTSERPCFDSDGPPRGIAILLSSKKAFCVEGTRQYLTPILDPFTACGSGLEYALAAMSLGFSAEIGVRTAHKFDAFTGDAVDVVKVRAK